LATYKSSRKGEVVVGYGDGGISKRATICQEMSRKAVVSKSDIRECRL
jgi:hypothetical protein